MLIVVQDQHLDDLIPVFCPRFLFSQFLIAFGWRISRSRLYPSQQKARIVGVLAILTRSRRCSLPDVATRPWLHSYYITA